MPPRAAPAVSGGAPRDQEQLTRRPRGSSNSGGAAATSLKKPAPANKPLQFVNITDPNQRHDDKNRKLVRSQAMRDFRKKQQTTNPKSQKQRAKAGGTTIRQIAGPLPATQSESTALVLQNNPLRGVPEGVWARMPQPMSPRTSLVTCLGAGFVDPFAQAAVETKPYMYGLMEHFIRWLSPGQTPSQRAQNPIVTILVPLARSNAALFHAAVSAAAANMTAQRGGKDPDYWSFYHRGHALRLLQNDLALPKNRTSDVTIATILLISSSDHFFGNLRAFEMHKKAVQQIIVSRGGLDNLGLNGILKRVILWMTLAGAGTTAPTPHIKKREEEASSSSEPESLASTPSSVDSTSSQSALPSAFTRLVHSGLVSLDILSPMQVGCTLIKHRQQNEPLPENFTEYASSASRPIEMQLAEMVGPIFLHLRNLRNTLTATAKGSVEHCISIAAPIYYCTVLLGMPFDAPELDGLSKQLALAMQVRAYDWQWKTEYGCRLWLNVMGDAASAKCWERRLSFAADVKRTIQSWAPGMEYEDFQKACEEWLWEPNMINAAVGLWAVMKQLGDAPLELTA